MRHAEGWGWEQALLGTILFSPEKMDDIGSLMPGDFSGCHKWIFREMLNLHRQETLEPRVLIEKLREDGKLDACADIFSETQGEDYIYYIVGQRGAALDEYINSVKSISGKRSLEAASALIAADALDRRVTFDDAIDRAERRLTGLRRNQEVAAGTSIGDLFRVFVGRVNDFRAGSFIPAYVPQVGAIQKMVQYFENDEYVIAASRPGEGKSSFMRYDFLMSAMQGNPTLIVNMENNELEYAKAALGITLGIDTMLLKDPSLLTEEQLRLVIAKADELSSVPWHIVSMAGPSANEIDRAIRPYIKEGLSLIGVDYIQLAHNGLEKKNDDITVSSQTFRTMTRKYKVPIIANAQLNRSIEHRGVGAMPMLSDLRDSGSLEQDATQVWFYRSLWPEPTNEQLRTFSQNINRDNTVTARAIPTRAIIAKNRNGPTGETDPFLWDKSTGVYSALRTTRTNVAHLQ